MAQQLIGGKFIANYPDLITGQLKPAVGYKLYTYVSGTVTPQATYSDVGLTVPNTNPVILDTRGEASVFLTPGFTYTFVLKSASGSTVWTRDGISGAVSTNDLASSAGAGTVGFDYSGTYASGTVGKWLKDLALSTGASFIGFIQSGVGAVLTTVQAALRLYPSVTQWGVTGDGVTDDTVNFQKAIDAINARGGGRLLVPKATYMLGKLYMKSNVTLIIETGAVLQAINNIFGVNDRFLNIDGVSNICIEGNHAVIRMNNEYASGEQRHNVFMVDAHNVVIRDLHADDSGGDGFYIGRNAAGTHCTNITIENCYADGNRRQGLSWVSGTGINIIGGLYSATSGTSPQYGIDIEPNDSDDEIRGSLIGVTTSNNNGGGFLIAMKNLVNTANKNIQLSIIGCKSYSDNASNSTIGASLRFAGDGAAWSNTLSGSIIVRDFQSFDCKGSGIIINDWDYLKGARIDIDGVRVVNPNADGVATQPYDQCGVAVYTGGLVSGVGNFSIRNMEISGANLYTGAYMADTNGPIRSFTLHDVINKAASTSSGFIQYVSAAGPNVDSAITYSKEQIVSLSGTANLSNYPGQTIEITAGGVYTLPAAADAIGQKFILRLMVTATVEISPSGVDNILGWSVTAGGRLVMNRAGDLVILKATTAGWVPEFISHYAQRPKATNTTSPRKIVWGSAPPTDGTWDLGDMMINVAPAVGSPKGWRCTVAGTPGTWVSEGNL